MTNKPDEALAVYEDNKHWPPFTYRDYPEAVPETLQAFIDFFIWSTN